MVRKKMHICKKIARKFTFECDFVGNGLHSAAVASRWASVARSVTSKVQSCHST